MRNSAIPSFFDVKDIGDLKAQPLMENDAILKEELTARGRKFVELQGTHYLEYKGYMMQPDRNPQTPMPFPSPLLGSPPIKSLHFQVLNSNTRLVVDERPTEESGRLQELYENGSTRLG